MLRLLGCVYAVLYRYQFARPGNPAGDWWQREELGPWLPPWSADDSRLINFVREAGWLHSTNSSSKRSPGQSATNGNHRWSAPSFRRRALLTLH